MLGTKFHSKSVCDEKYIKTKVKTFNAVVNTVICSDEISKEDVHYTFIAAISMYSVIKMDKNVDMR